MRATGRWRERGRDDLNDDRTSGRIIPQERRLASLERGAGSAAPALLAQSWPVSYTATNSRARDYQYEKMKVDELGISTL